MSGTLIDDIKHKGLRQRLVALIRSKGISDELVLQAIGTVPRHFFVDTFVEHRAYDDTPLPIGAQQTISQPYTVAFQTALLGTIKGAKILEIGTGSGYQTAVLLQMGAKVFTIERQRELYQRTRIALPKMGYNAHFHYGDGYVGLPTYGPFDAILVTAGAPDIPKELLQQLKVNGNMVLPVGGTDGQVMTRITKTSETNYTRQDFGHFIFVPLLPGVKP